MSASVYIYGAGKIGRETASMVLAAGKRILAWVDANPARAGEEQCGAKIYGVEDFPDDRESRIIVAVAGGYDAIRQTLMERGVREDRIVRYSAFFLGVARGMAGRIPCGDASSVEEQDADVYISQPLGFVLGGVESFALVLYERLRTMGKRVKFLCLPNEAGIPDRVRQDVITLPNGASYAENVEAAMRFWRAHPGKIVIMHWMEEISLAAAALQKSCGFRILSILHSDVENIYRNNCCLAPYISAFIGVSDLACRHLMEAGVDASCVHSVTLPIEGTERLERTYSAADAPLVLGYAGRIVQRPKRIDLQLELIRRLEAAGVAYEYHFIGSGTYEAKVRAFIEHESLGGHVFLHPPCDRAQIGAFWQRMDACISTSLWEGRGISILEAMMWGAVPVITETAGAHQDIEDGKSGYIVPIGDVDAMMAKVMELAVHRDRLPVMGKRAHEHARSYGDFTSFDALWRKLCDGDNEIS